MNNQYTFQEFLLDCPYRDIQIEKYRHADSGELIQFGTEYNLMDYSNGVVRRGITLSQLDRIIDTEEDFRCFVMDHQWIEELVMINNRPRFKNPILDSYSMNTIKAYLYRFNDAGIKCSLYNQ